MTDPLSINLCGLQLKSPLILASGILGVSLSSMKNFIDAGGGAVTSKSIGPIPRKGYKNPSIFEVNPGTFINSVGLGNPGVEEFCKETEEFEDRDFPLIVSIFGDNEDSYLNVAKKVEDMGCDAIELNISCPHAKVSSIGISPKLTESLVLKLKKKVSVPIFVKLNPNVTDIREIAFAAEKGGADAVTAINTLAAMVIDVNTKRPILSHGSGGLSGKAIHPIAVKMVYDLYKELTIPIIGCGGIFTWEEVIEFFLAGASAVQIGTALYQGVDVLMKISENLRRFLKEHKYLSISELIGIAHNYNIQEVPEF